MRTSWNEYCKSQRIKINRKRKREKLEPLSYKEVMKVCSTTWPTEKAKLVKRHKKQQAKKAISE